MLKTRLLKPEDLELVCLHRELMFREAGRDQEILAQMTASFRPWLKPRLEDGSYFGFVVMDAEQPIGSIGLMEIEWPPHPSHPMQDRRGYVLNVYVDTQYRKQGIARLMMKAAEEEFARRGVQFAILHATAMGRPLYETMGWNATTEMSKAMPI